MSQGYVPWTNVHYKHNAILVSLPSIDFTRSHHQKYRGKSVNCSKTSMCKSLVFPSDSSFKCTRIASDVISIVASPYWKSEVSLNVLSSKQVDTKEKDCREAQLWKYPSAKSRISIHDNLWCNATDTVSADDWCMDRPDRKWKYECKYQMEHRYHLITNHFSWSFLQGNEFIIKSMSTGSGRIYIPFCVGPNETYCVSWWNIQQRLNCQEQNIGNRKYTQSSSTLS